MRKFFYGLAFVLLVLAGAAAVAEALHLVTGEAYRPVSLGSIWYGLHGNSLVGFQALVEKSVGPLLWTPIQFVLTLPAWLVLAVPGIILLLVCRPRQRGLRSL